MKICKYCGIIFQDVSHCPKCGMPLKGRTWSPIWFIVCVIAILGGILMLFECLIFPYVRPAIRAMTSLGGGIYVVGEDIPAGEYVILTKSDRFAEKYAAQFHIDIHGNGTDYAGWEEGSLIFRLEEGQTIEVPDDAFLYSSSKSSVLYPFNFSGMFCAGRDFPPGTYRVVGTSKSYSGVWEVYQEAGADMKDSLIYGGDSVYCNIVTVREGEYLQTSYCRLSRIPQFSSADTRRPEEKTANLPDGCYGEDTYEVGADILAGEYVICSDGSRDHDSFYFAVYEDAEMEQKIAGGWMEWNTIMRLEEGQFISMQAAYFYESSRKSLLKPFQSSGFFLVGRDLKAGTYTIANDTEQLAVYRVFSDPDQKEEHMLLQGPLQGGENTEITLHDGEYLMTRFCHLEK